MGTPQSHPPARKMGTTEKAYRDWVRSLGPLTNKQAAQAEALFVMACQMDAIREGIARGEPVTSGSAAAINREMRTASAELRDVARMPAQAPENKPADTVDQVAAARAKRIAGGVA